MVIILGGLRLASQDGVQFGVEQGDQEHCGNGVTGVDLPHRATNWTVNQ
jgi:hypothetical protein